MNIIFCLSLGPPGANGEDGKDGEDGVDGKDGAVCSVVDTEASGVTDEGGQQNSSTESVDMGTFTGSVNDLTVDVDVSGATVDVTVQGGKAAPIQVQTDVRQPYPYSYILYCPPRVVPISFLDIRRRSGRLMTFVLY